MSADYEMREFGVLRTHTGHVMRLTVCTGCGCLIASDMQGKHDTRCRPQGVTSEIHNPWSIACVRRGIGEPSEPEARCPTCDKP